MYFSFRECRRKFLVSGSLADGSRTSYSRPGLMHRSDLSVLFASRDYTDLLKDHHITIGPKSVIDLPGSAIAMLRDRRFSETVTFAVSSTARVAPSAALLASR